MGFLDDVIDNVGEPYGGANGFEYGTHEVIIGAINPTDKKLKSGKTAKVIEVEVFDEKDNDKTATCTLYFHTEGGTKMSVAKVLGILVHNIGEEKKDKVRELGRQLFAKLEDLTKARDVAAKLMTDKLVEKKAYLVAQPSGNYKTTSYGELWHYPAEPQGEPENAAQKAAKDVGGSVVNLEDPTDYGDL